MKLLLDEMIPPAVAVKLRERGRDVVCVHERGSQGLDDPGQLEDASREDRAIATYNITHFLSLVTLYAEQGRRHGGVILISPHTVRQSDIGRLVRSLDAICQDYPADEALTGQCRYVRRAPDE